MAKYSLLDQIVTRKKQKTHRDIPWWVSGKMKTLSRITSHVKLDK